MIYEPVQGFTGNVSSEMGHVMEPVIINLYKYYDKSKADQMDMFANMKNKSIKNKVICRHNYVVNDKYPHLSASPDGFVKKGILECKNTTSMEANKYENKVSPSHIIQCHHNLIVTRREFCDLLLFIDGKWLEVITIEPDKAYRDEIIECSYKFFRTVLQARAIKIEYDIKAYYGINEDSLTSKQKEGVAMLHALEPAFTGTDREADFISDMIKPTPEYTEMAGTNEQFELLLRRSNINSDIKSLESDKNIIENQLKLSLSGKHRAVFENGYFSVAPKWYVHPKLLK
jgi:predicted phage-related endonuclease